MFVPESLRRQNELIRTLQKQLEATQRELADQKWILDQYLQSPSWRLTAPLRWIVRQIRAIKQLLLNVLGNAAASEHEWVGQTDGDIASESPERTESGEAVAELKELYSSLYRVTLQTFLTSNAALDLPTVPDPETSVILVLYNRAELTLSCLRALRENFSHRFEVIIVDNASTDDTSRLLDRIHGARIIRNAENRHFLLAVNQAANEAQGKFLLLLNNDAQLLPGAFGAALETLQSQNDIGAVGGKLVLLDGSLQEAGSIIWRDGSCLGYGRGDNPFSSAYMFRRDVDYCSGAFLLTRRSTWKELGGFDETYVPAYYEETDFCMRLWEKGLRVVYEPSAVVIHYEFASASTTRSATDLQAKHQEIFAKRHAASLRDHAAADPAAVLAARMHGNRRRVLFLDDRVPHPWLGSGFPRARTMLLALRKSGFFVTLFPMDPAVLEEDWNLVYSDLPRDTEVMNEMGPQLLEAFLRNRRNYYDAIIVSRPHNMNYLRPILTAHPDWFETTPVIYDAEALFAPRDIDLRKLRGEVLTESEIEKVYRDEISLASPADCVMAVSQLDREAFLSHGIQRVYVLGHALQAAPTPRPFAGRSGLLFIGAIHDEGSPNGDSMIWFISEIWPLIQSALGPGATLTIAGVNKSERIASMAGPSIRILGHRESVTDLYDRARVFVAPTRFAAGIPHKVHEASARGVPVVATPVLARQLAWKDEVEVGVAGDAESFAAKCIALHENELLWNRMRDSALDAIRKDCSVDAFEQQFLDILAAERIDRSRKRYADARMDR